MNDEQIEKIADLVVEKITRKITSALWMSAREIMGRSVGAYTVLNVVASYIHEDEYRRLDYYGGEADEADESAHT